MTFVPHLRLTFSGKIGTSGEIFSCSLSLVPDHAAWAAALDAAARTEILTAALADLDGTSNWDDLVADVVAFWTDPFARVTTHARLKRVKLAAIGENGLYTAAPLEAAADEPGPQDVAPHPNQIARKITMETDGDLARVKGGFYLPSQSTQGWAVDTNLWDVDNTEGVRDAVTDFIDNLNNVPGLDGDSYKVVVASQGRHNSDGSVRRAPANDEVKRVNVGRRADVIRRRANKLSEARIADATVA